MREQQRELMSEDELKRRQRKRALRPYKNGAKKVGKGIYDVVRGLAKVPIEGIQYLGRESAKNARRSPKDNGRIDIGLGTSRQPRKLSRPSSPRLNKDTVKHRNEVYDIVERGRRIKVAKAKVMARRKRDSRNRF